MGGWVGGWMDGWKRVWMDGWMDGKGFILFACSMCIALTILSHVQAGDELISTHTRNHKGHSICLICRKDRSRLFFFGFTGATAFYLWDKFNIAEPYLRMAGIIENQHWYFPKRHSNFQS